jgi:hypothetical protein
LGVAERVDEVLWACHPGVAHELSQGLRVLESAFTGFLFEGRTVPFTACSPEQQDAILDAWRRSGLPLRRTVYKAIRGLVVSAYWSSPGVYAYLEYPGPPAYR